MTSILTPRLELVSLSPEFLRASLGGRADEAAALLGATLPADWPAGHEFVLRLRLTQLERDPAQQPWLLRGILLRPQAIPEPPRPPAMPEGLRRPAIPDPLRPQATPEGNQQARPEAKPRQHSIPEGKSDEEKLSSGSGSGARPASAKPRPATMRCPQDIPEGKTSSSGSGSGVRPGSEKLAPLIGLIGFHGPPDTWNTLEIGYRVLPAYRRRGYATEAVEALLAWATHEHGIHAFKASVSPSNEPSLRMVRKLGFHHTGEQWDEEDGLELVFERHTETPRPYTPHDTT